MTQVREETNESSGSGKTEADEFGVEGKTQFQAKNVPEDTISPRSPVVIDKTKSDSTRSFQQHQQLQH